MKRSDIPASAAAIEWERLLIGLQRATRATPEQLSQIAHRISRGSLLDPRQALRVMQGWAGESPSIEYIKTRADEFLAG